MTNAVISAVTSNPWFLGAVLNSLLMVPAILIPKKLLTPAGLVHAWALGVIIWATLGWQGYSVMMFYFLVGSAVTRIGMAEKEAAGIAEKRSGARGPENVWGSALTGVLCALGIWVIQTFGDPIVNTESGSDVSSIHLWVPLLILGYVASLSTKLSDTSASEVGKAYGKRTFLITTLKAVPPGTEGAVSLEGTLAGIVASIAIALVAWGVGLISPLGIVICILAAFIATNAESVIGATIQEKIIWLTNEIVNIINTLIGAIAAIALMVLITSLKG